MPNDLSPQDIQDLQQIASQLKPGDPRVAKVSQLLSSQPTQFEQQRSGGPGLMATMGDYLARAGKGLVSPPTGTEAVTSGMGPLPGIIESGVKGFMGARERGHGLPYSAAAGAAAPLGVDAGRMEQAAARGDTGGVLGEAAIPATLAVAPIAGEAAGAGREFVGSKMYDPATGKLLPAPRIAGQLGGGAIGGAAGEAVGHPYAGGIAGYKAGPELLKRAFPEPAEQVAARTSRAAYEQMGKSAQYREMGRQTPARGSSVTSTGAGTEPSGIRPTETEQAATQLGKSPIWSTGDEQTAVRIWGDKAHMQPGEGLMNYRARLQGYGYAARSGQGMQDIEHYPAPASESSSGERWTPPGVENEPGLAPRQSPLSKLPSTDDLETAIRNRGQDPVFAADRAKSLTDAISGAPGYSGPERRAAQMMIDDYLGPERRGR